MLDKNWQEIKDGNNNIQSGRDINLTNNLYISTNKKEEKDIGIIADILDFIFQNKIKVEDIEPTKDEKNKEIFVNLKEKIPLNFKDQKQQDDVNKMFINLWSTIRLVEKYLAEIEDQGKILRLREQIQTEFRKLKDQNNDILKIFNELPLLFLQDDKKTNPDYHGGAKAIILYFFEYCDIGSKTKKEKLNEKSLFD